MKYVLGGGVKREKILGFNWGDGWGKIERWIFMDVDKWYEGRRVGEKAEFFV